MESPPTVRTQMQRVKLAWQWVVTDWAVLSQTSSAPECHPWSTYLSVSVRLNVLNLRPTLRVLHGLILDTATVDSRPWAVLVYDALLASFVVNVAPLLYWLIRMYHSCKLSQHTDVLDGDGT